jgi:peptide/nickel transport system permease protein
VSAYFGGKVDLLLQRLMDVFLSFPLIVLAMAVVAVLGTGVLNVILAITIPTIPQVARVVRSSALSVRAMPYVESARTVGAGHWRIIARHMLPNAVGPILVNATLAIAAAIITESTLSFLGFGVQPPTVSWGNMLAQSEGTVGTPTSYLIYSPGLAILLTVLAINFLGDGLRDAFDPQSTR